MKFFESGRLLRTLLVLSVLFFLSSTIGFFYGNFDKAMGFLAAGFVAFALSSVFGEGIFRQLAFTIWIAAGVAVGFAFHESFLIFPGWVPGLGELEMSIIFIPVLQVIMFAMGTTLSVFDFSRAFKMPLGIIIGLCCQFTIMPLLGFALAHAFSLPVGIAAGLVLVGSSPSGLASNVMAFVAKANVAMSVTMTAFSTMLAPILTPLLMKALAGEMVEIDVPSMMWTMTKIVLLPVLAGLVFHHLAYKRFRGLEPWMPVVSMIGILILTVLTVALGHERLLQVGVVLLLACIIHSFSGFTLGYYACKLLGRDQLTCRTIALEVGLQNAGMAAGVAKSLGKVATLGLVPIVFGPVMNISASILANWWSKKPITKN